MEVLLQFTCVKWNEHRVKSWTEYRKSNQWKTNRSGYCPLIPQQKSLLNRPGAARLLCSGGWSSVVWFLSGGLSAAAGKTHNPSLYSSKPSLSAVCRLWGNNTVTVQEHRAPSDLLLLVFHIQHTKRMKHHFFWQCTEVCSLLWNLLVLQRFPIGGP